jgi:dimeric dUTPase (all-alpha-NTP-PPase superfamily)
MNVSELFTMQQELDRFIEEGHQLLEKDLFDQKVLALLVEVSELANETRCFKFWSTKGPSPQEVILEEYVDGLHFILSLGIEVGFHRTMKDVPSFKEAVEPVEQFLRVYEAIHQFRKEKCLSVYEHLLSEYLALGKLYGFTPEGIYKAYVAKNKVNFQRQQQGY